MRRAAAWSPMLGSASIFIAARAPALSLEQNSQVAATEHGVLAARGRRREAEDTHLVVQVALTASGKNR